MLKRYSLLLPLFLILCLPGNLYSQIVLDSSNVYYFDNTSDNNTGTTATNGTLMNDPKYREFLQNNPIATVTDGFWSNNSSLFWGGNSRRASRSGSGNNTGARGQFYCTVPVSDDYIVYHQMNSANATTNAVVKFFKFGQELPVDSFRYDMRSNITVDGRGSWVPLGIVNLVAVDSALTVEMGLDSLGANTLRLDALILVRSTKTGPKIEFGARRYTETLPNTPVTGDTAKWSFYKHRAPLGFAETTFKWNSKTSKTIPIYNLGSQALVITGFTANTNRFSVTTPFPITIQPGKKSVVTLQFSPRGEETTIDTIVFLNNDPDEPQAKLPVQGTGINYNFILNASVNGSEPHWNAPGGSSSLIGSFLTSTPSPFPYPIPGGNNGSVVNTGSDPNIAVLYKFTIPDTLSGSYFMEYAGPVGSANAAQNVTVDAVTPFYTNPNPALGDTQRVTGFNSRIPSTIQFARIGGNTIFKLNAGGETTVRYTNPSQGGTELLRADLLRIRLVPIQPTIATSLDPGRLLNYGSVSIYDSIRNQEFNYQRSFVIGSNGETPLKIDTIYLKTKRNFTIVNMPRFPLTLPAVDGKYTLLMNFLPDSLISYRDTVVIRSNDRNDTLVQVRLSGQGVGTGINVDDSDPTTYIYPASPIVWTGTPDPTNMDKWYRVQGSGGINQNRLFHYIYFNPPTGKETVEWFPFFPNKPGVSNPQPDSFDVYVNLSVGASTASPRAKYIVYHIGNNRPNPDTIIVNQNSTSVGGQVGSSGQVYLGRYTFLRGGQDYHGGGAIFGYVQLVNDTALVSAFYRDSVINRARQDSFVLRADAIVLQQAGAPLGIVEPNVRPTEYSLMQNYPNPFNPTTMLKFAIPFDERVELKVYDLLGREVATIVSDNLRAGNYTYEWNGKNDFGQPVSTGMYIYRIKAGKFVQAKKMLLMK